MIQQPLSPPKPKFPRFQAPVPQAAPASVVGQEATSVGSASFWMAVIYTFLLFSRSVEFIDNRGRFHLAILTGAICTLALIMSGNLPRMLISKQAKWLNVLCFWIFAGLPFSMWKGGSVQIFTSIWIKSYVMFFIVGGLIFSLKQMRTMIIVLAFSSLYQIYLALHGGVIGGDRLQMTYGTLGNSNDLATSLLMGLPFITYIMFDSAANFFLRLASFPVTILLLVAVLKTGSRGALVAMTALIAVAFYKSTAANKVKIAVACFFLVGLFAAVVPSSLRARYMTIFSDKAVSEEAASAIDSSNARRELFKNSVALTLRHPVFGVGLGQFAPQSFNLLIAEGKPGMWFTSHDIFALISAETGLPSLIFFCGLMVVSFRPMWRMAQIKGPTPEIRLISGLAYSLMMSMVAFFVCGIFGTQAYSYQLPVLASLSVALERVSRPYLDSVVNVAPNPFAAPAPFVNRRLAQNRPVSATS